MRVLVACECSQTVCKSFRELGHEAYSCDNDCIDEDDVCGDIIEALKAVKGKYIKAFKELDAGAEKGEAR